MNAHAFRKLGARLSSRRVGAKLGQVPDLLLVAVLAQANEAVRHSGGVNIPARNCSASIDRNRVRPDGTGGIEGDEFFVTITQKTVIATLSAGRDVVSRNHARGVDTGGKRANGVGTIEDGNLAIGMADPAVDFEQVDLVKRSCDRSRGIDASGFGRERLGRIESGKAPISRAQETVLTETVAVISRDLTARVDRSDDRSLRARRIKAFDDAVGRAHKTMPRVVGVIIRAHDCPFRIDTDGFGVR